VRRRALSWLRRLGLRFGVLSGYVEEVMGPGHVRVTGRCRDCGRFYAWDDHEAEPCMGCERVAAGASCIWCADRGWLPNFPPEYCVSCRIAWGYC